MGRRRSRIHHEHVSPVEQARRPKSWLGAANAGEDGGEVRGGVGRGSTGSMAAAGWSSSPIASGGPRLRFVSGPRGCASRSSRTPGPAAVLPFQRDGEHRTGQSAVDLPAHSRTCRRAAGSRCSSPPFVGILGILAGERQRHLHRHVDGCGRGPFTLSFSAVWREAHHVQQA